jgi:hypothetical protein
MQEALAYINTIFVEADLYFCPQLLGAKRRTKNSVQTCTCLWADLDECPPDQLIVEPTIVVESSPGRYQAYWLLTEPLDPEEAEDYSRRIAYKHAGQGADKSGWDLTQLLRVPLTYNYKYQERTAVSVVKASSQKYTPEDFASYPQASGFEYLDKPMPVDLPTTTARDVLEGNRNHLNPRTWTLFYEEPIDDWSKPLWQLELLLFESGLSPEEVYIVANESACNKYRRDQRDTRLLWKEVCRAEAHVKNIQRQLNIVVQPETKPLLTDAERGFCNDTPTLIEDYVEWAKSLGDAAWQYHEVGAFVILSTLLAGYVRLPTSFGLVIPNLWFMILADTTLTRKTTAMDVAMDIVLDVDSDAILATDGSIEGLMQSLAARPGRASVFLRDEFSGLLEAMSKKDYYAGMQETLTKLYDGKFQRRVLRREVIEVRDPVLILFAGGIKTRVQELLRYDHVASGFVPRFLYVAAESDITRLRPLGPPTEQSLGQRLSLVNSFSVMRQHYDQFVDMKLGDKIIKRQKKWDAKLTPEAWVHYNRFEADLVASGLDSDSPELMTPTMDRLAKSGLKMAVLLAASRKLEQEVLVEEEDVIRAFKYIERWRPYTLELLESVGKGASERQLERIIGDVRRHPGISRSTLMQHYHLSSREATLIFETLIQRGLVVMEKKGRSEFYTIAN